MAAVASNSFISYTPNLDKKPQPCTSTASPPNPTFSFQDSRAQPFHKIEQAPEVSIEKKMIQSPVVKSLDRLEVDTKNLEKDVKMCIALEEVRNFVIFEEKIKMFYTDLEMIRIEKGSSLLDQKVAIEKRLLKCNNQLRKAKKAINAKKSSALFGSRKMNELLKIDCELEELEIQALTFEGLKSDKSYRELEQILENLWTRVFSIEAFEDDEKSAKEQLITKIKNVLQELKRRAEENEHQGKAIMTLSLIDEDLAVLKKQAQNFSGPTNDLTYLKLSNDLDSLCKQIETIEEPNEHVYRNKCRLSKDIQLVINNLAEQTTQEKSFPVQNEDPNYLKQVENFQKQWEEVNFNLEVQNTENPKEIIVILKKILESIGTKINALEIVERNQNINAHTQESSKLHQLEELHLQTIQTEIKVQPTVKTIAEMQRIGNEAKIILREIRETDVEKSGKAYENFREKLTICRTTLESIEYNKKSETIETTKKRISKTIDEAFGALEEKSKKCMEQKLALRTSTAFEVMDIDVEIQYLRQQIKNFTGTTKGEHYQKIKDGLTVCLVKLETMNDIQINKQDNIQLIQNYHQELETKLAENQVKSSNLKVSFKRQVSSEIKAIVEQVQKFKMQVDRFSGAFESLPYKQIEENLKTCSGKLDGVDVKGDEKLEKAKAQTKQKIQKYLNILEDKSTKSSKEVDEQEENQLKISSLDTNAAQDKINKLRDKLEVIKNKTQDFSGRYKDAGYRNIEEELLSCSEEFKSIDHQNFQPIIQSIQQYDDYIKKLLQYFEEKSKMNQIEEQSQLIQKIDDPLQILNVIDYRLKEFKKEVDNFKGTRQDEVYKDLREFVTIQAKELDEVEVGNVAHVREKKRKLMQELQKSTKLLETKAREQSKVELNANVDKNTSGDIKKLETTTF